MSNIRISRSIEEESLIQFLSEIDKALDPKISDRFPIYEYGTKLLSNANFFVARENGSINRINGLIAYYCNDPEGKEAYISILGLDKDHRNLGIGTKLLNAAIDYIRLKDFEVIYLETRRGSLAHHFYLKNGFIDCPRDSREFVTGEKFRMVYWLLGNELNLGLIPTPLNILDRIGSILGINLFIKRDDLFPFYGGGNKARKLKSILNKAASNGINAVLTAGSLQSNHIRATALSAAVLGWPSILIIHDKKPKQYKGNIQVARVSGAELRFVKREEVAVAMDIAKEDLIKRGLKPLYIWGGGHCLDRAKAYYEAVKELKMQLGNVKPDFIVLASGTGTTQAGIEVGIRKYLPGCKVLGVSISYNVEKGKKVIWESMIELNNDLLNPVELVHDINFDDHFIGGEYGAIYPEVLDTIRWAAKTEGVILDPTYSGKAFYALRSYINSGAIPEASTVVFWHTGGLLNLLASEMI